MINPAMRACSMAARYALSKDIGSTPDDFTRRFDGARAASIKPTRHSLSALAGKGYKIHSSVGRRRARTCIAAVPSPACGVPTEKARSGRQSLELADHALDYGKTDAPEDGVLRVE